MSLKSPISLCTVQLRLSFNGVDLSTGSAFFYEHSGKTFVVTNRHNLTGRHQDTGEALHSMGGVPNQVRFQVPVPEQIGNTMKFGRVLAEHELKWDLASAPPWIEHANLGAAVDVVALDYHAHWPKAPKPFAHANLIPDSPLVVLQPALPVSVVGYPFGQALNGHYPIWVSGALASEPDFNAGDRPAMFIDCRTNKGSSGSPVFAYAASGIVEIEKTSTNPKPFMEYCHPNGRISAMFGTPVNRFVGIYSGRIHDGADIGLVWRDDVIQDVCSNTKT